jgi:glucose/mannose-6-phosphate isomerase
MTSSFRDEVAGIPAQIATDPELGGEPLPEKGRLVVAGLGGSGLAGELTALLQDPGRETVLVREDALPGWVDPSDALLCLSYSGRTHETLALWNDAAARGLRRAAVASGGALLERARAEGAGHAVPPGGLSPRGALGHLVRGAAALTVPPVLPDWSEASRHLSGIRDRWDAEDGTARRLAAALRGRLPVLLAAEPAGLAVARRWAADLAENAKVAAVVWGLPEAAHNAVMALAAEARPQVPLALLALGRPRGPAAVLRWDATLQVLADHGARVTAVAEPHSDPWIEALGLAYAGDWVSVVLAEALGADASSLSLMNDLKRLLSAGADPNPKDS